MSWSPIRLRLFIPPLWVAASTEGRLCAALAALREPSESISFSISSFLTKLFLLLAWLTAKCVSGMFCTEDVLKILRLPALLSLTNINTTSGSLVFRDEHTTLQNIQPIGYVADKQFRVQTSGGCETQNHTTPAGLCLRLRPVLPSCSWLTKSWLLFDSAGSRKE